MAHVLISHSNSEALYGRDNNRSTELPHLFYSNEGTLESAEVRALATHTRDQQSGQFLQASQASPLPTAMPMPHRLRIPSQKPELQHLHLTLCAPWH
jgi:hypothetical protein